MAPNGRISLSDKLLEKYVPIELTASDNGSQTLFLFVYDNLKIIGKIITVESTIDRPLYKTFFVQEIDFPTGNILRRIPYLRSDQYKVFKVSDIIDNEEDRYILQGTPGGNKSRRRKIKKYKKYSRK